MAVDQGFLLGPRMQISVTPLSITGGHFDFWLKSGFDMKTSYPGHPDSICDGIDGVQRKTREVLRAGADVVKVMVTGGVMSANDKPEYTQFTVDELKVIVKEANYRNIKTMAHAHGVGGIKNAIKAGIHSIEHGTYLDQESITMMLDNGTYLVPTLLVMKINRELAESGSMPAYGIEDALRIEDIHRRNIKKAYKAGVTIAMGTDSGVIKHGINLQELSLLCNAGMKPMEAILSGTKVASECLGWQDKVGTLETGKLADIIITNTDPLKNIESLGNPNNIPIVIKDGKIVNKLLLFLLLKTGLLQLYSKNFKLELNNNYKIGDKKMAVDPICKMDVDEGGAQWTSSFKGKKYYFCAKRCLEEFEKNPEKYAKTD
jgi:imidazolonepropionase-like amidohydrolase/YHS domain-containing protein